MQALLLLDVQNDYGALGALAVQDSEKIVGQINKLSQAFDTVIASKNWHPANHIKFAANHPWRYPGQSITINEQEQELFVIHNVQNSFGAEFMFGLQTDAVKEVFLKGTDAQTDSFSAFKDKNGQATGLSKYLKTNNITQLFVVGISVNDSMFHTLMDASNAGFDCRFITDCCKAFDDENYANNLVDRLQNTNIICLNSTELLNKI